MTNLAWLNYNFFEIPTKVVKNVVEHTKTSNINIIVKNVNLKKDAFKSIELLRITAMRGDYAIVGGNFDDALWFHLSNIQLGFWIFRYIIESNQIEWGLPFENRSS